jgi:hypothetical protein
MHEVLEIMATNIERTMFSRTLVVAFTTFFCSGLSRMRIAMLANKTSDEDIGLRETSF